MSSFKILISDHPKKNSKLLLACKSKDIKLHVNALNLIYWVLELLKNFTDLEINFTARNNAV